MLNNSRNKRIVKNTLLLYGRLIITMVVNLFTSRVILNKLGVDDFGVFNVVAGTVLMFSFFTSSLSSAISRFLTFELGKNNEKKLSVIFSTSVNVLIICSIIVFVIAEILGVWFLNNKLNIPFDRIFAANVVLQSSIIIFIMNLISVPYNAIIIAHEKMSAFAYISILEVILKLIVAFILYISYFDNLITYSLLLMFVSILIRFVYGVYCNKQFVESKYKLVYDKKILKEMSGFAGWNMIGSSVFLLNTQGINIVSNIFFGVTVNAARGIANQVDSVVKQFVLNFTTAVNPQIVKSYASNEKKYMFDLVCKSAKYSYFLMLFFTIPFIYETEIILSLWLKTVPLDSAIFVRLSLIGSMVDILGNSTANAAWATGKVRRYYILVGVIGSLVFPISYVFFKMGYAPDSAYYVFIFIYIILVFVKVYILKGLLDFPINKYIKEVILKIIPVTIFSFIIPGLFYFYMDYSLHRFFMIILMSISSVFFMVYVFGLEKSEKVLLLNIIKNKLKK